MKRISVDFGSEITKIYMPGCGVVLMEATCIAVEKFLEDGETNVVVKAYGDKARALSGRAAANTFIVNPVSEGKIVQENLAVELLSRFLEKIEISRREARRTEAVFILPCGVKEEVKEKYRRVADECGIGSVYFTYTPFAAVLGQNITINESTPMFTLDIGYSLTNIAAVSQDGLITGISVNLGGGNIDVQIIDDLADRHNLKIGNLTAEKLKNTVGSLFDDDNKMNVIEGRDVKTGAPASVAINSSQLSGAILKYADKILEYVNKVLTKLPAEVSSAVMHGGIYLSGGLVKLDGFAEYIEKQLQIPVNVPEEPQLATVIGGGAIISNDRLFEMLTTD
ncbi:MAG: rod shape-determining protein [Clostridia bacterium]|nr:rod shape-determining protein [Clostridia bacterium]